VWRIWIFAALACTVFGGEIRCGSGTFGMKGGFLGFTASKSTDIELFLAISLSILVEAAQRLAKVI
jgi:hypothetical protein